MTFTLPASRFPAIGQIFYVGLPLAASNPNPPVKASDFMALLETNVMFYLDENNNYNFVTLVDLQQDPGSDFDIDGGIAYIVINGKNNTSGPNVVFSGDAWCNTFDSQTNTTSLCP